MVFTSFTFMLGFLPLVILLYFAAPGTQWKNRLLTVCSLLFYAWGEPFYVGLLLFSAIIDHFHGRWAEATRGTKSARLPVISCVVVNLGLLGVFKYSAMLTETVNQTLGTTVPSPELALPIGISFYTFQTMTYVIDVANGKVERQKSFADFLLYVSLFPQLIAGPIVRYADVSKDLVERTHTIPKVASGLERFAIGLFKKTFFANIAAELVAQTMDLPLTELALIDAWFGAILFGLQIYFDFSGYSDMAIGLGLIFGFRYPENFDHPYTSKNVREFWQRWHMTLGSFFRDYLYIPLGGRRAHWVRNLFVVWFLTGLWHGASWNFVVWGLYFGVFMYLEQFMLRRVLEKLPGVLTHLYLLVVVVIGWVFFYFEDLGHGLAYIEIMLNPSSPGISSVTPELLLKNFWWFIAACVACMPTRSWVVTRILNRHRRKGKISAILINTCSVVVLVVLWLSSLSMLSTTTFNPFIYFRF